MKKRRPIIQKQTILIVGEGADAYEFLRLLKQYFSVSAVYVTLKDGKGGSQECIVSEALKSSFAIDYDYKYVFIDDDKDDVERRKAVKKAEDNSIDIIWALPCIEALFLSMLNPGKDFSRLKSSVLKSKFKRDHLKNTHRDTFTCYERLFGKELLEQERKHIPTLNYLIEIIEGKRILTSNKDS